MMIPHPTKTKTCSRCGDKLEVIADLKDKIKTCEKKKCACKKASFQKECADFFECSTEDFISVVHIELNMHPVESAYVPPPAYQGPMRPKHGGSWLCINDPMRDCDCEAIPGNCHYFYGMGY